jgi:hypothetical protein
MIDYGELVLTRTPATVEVIGEAPEWTLMSVALLRDMDAVFLHDDGLHVTASTGWDAPIYAIVGWDHVRKALILRRCLSEPWQRRDCSSHSLSVDPADIPPVEDEEITKP